jgi:hypothetical protein
MTGDRLFEPTPGSIAERMAVVAARESADFGREAATGHPHDAGTAGTE